MKVYVLMADSYESTDVLGIFDDLQTAKNMRVVYTSPSLGYTSPSLGIWFKVVEYETNVAVIVPNLHKLKTWVWDYNKEKWNKII